MYKLVLAEFPFTEGKGKKTRPVLLLTDGSYGRHKIVMVAYMTSRSGEGIESEVEVEKTGGNGLRKKSIIKLHKITSIPESAIKGELGKLSKEQSIEIKDKLVRLFQL